MFDIVLWGGLTGLGAFGAYLDGRKLRRPWCGLALLAESATGAVIAWIVPPRLVDAGLFMAGVQLLVAAALGMTGYLMVGLVFVVARQIARLRR